MNDAPKLQQTDHKDKYISVKKEIDSWRVSRRKGSLTVYFDGSGRIPRYTLTTEGQ